MFVLILVSSLRAFFFSDFETFWRLAQANLHRTRLNAKGYPTMDFCLS